MGDSAQWGRSYRHTLRARHPQARARGSRRRAAGTGTGCGRVIGTRPLLFQFVHFRLLRSQDLEIFNSGCYTLPWMRRSNCILQSRSHGGFNHAPATIACSGPRPFLRRRGSARPLLRRIPGGRGSHFLAGLPEMDLLWPCLSRRLSLRWWFSTNTVSSVRALVSEGMTGTGKVRAVHCGWTRPPATASNRRRTEAAARP